MSRKIRHVIVGAGIGGLAAAAELKSRGENDFIIIERSAGVPMNLHNGLHYLHTTDFETPFRFSFKRNPMTEEIWNTRNNTFSKTATLPEAIEYSKKVMESKRHITSIMDPGKRKEVFVPEDDNMNTLLAAYVDYIGMEHFLFSTEVKSVVTTRKSILISTMEEIEYSYLITSAPLNDWYSICQMTCPYELKHKSLYITNFENYNIVKNWLIVLYMSDPKFPPHRITAMNGILSMESMRELTHDDDVIIKYHIGELFDYDLSTRTSYCWTTGRIFGLDNHKREEVSSHFESMNIYLLGRFANWNGKLLIDTTILQAKEIVNNKIYGTGNTKGN